MNELSDLAAGLDWDIGYLTLTEERGEVVAALRELADWYEARKDQTDRLCLDCEQDTQEMREYYMVQDDLWKTVNPDVDGMLCVGCLETRLGRTLTPADFTEAPCNTEFPHSPRLQARLARAA